MPFIKGQSGNPSGRPKVNPELRELAREYTSEALLTLADVMRDADAPPAARVTAANSLLDRGYGKPTQEITGDLNLNHTHERMLDAIEAGDMGLLTADGLAHEQGLH